ncbi:uncharacterized protein LOC125946866 isoform X1 [Dermacentor silvarum]|uniref:uncharacterized protein LOC125946866 isoform X1 n=1 Tax=Dermacentor silvarum TaxID=543639 RepID=UPI0021017019|nr:uncharacterized protein LOC125946866 isoform X1 [Dermacentor silvarum]
MSTYGGTSWLLDYRRTWRPKSENLAEAVTNLFKRKEKALLLKISRAAWFDSECRCMESAFSGTMSDEFIETLSCHARSNAESEPPAMTKTTAEIIFKVQKTNGETEIKLRVLDEQAPLPFDLRRKYKVLAATSTCAVFKIAETITGEFLCALWGVVDAHHNDEDDCFNAIERLCLQPLTDLFHDRANCGEQFNMTEVLN